MEKQQPNTGGATNFAGRAAWKTEPSKEGEELTKIVNGVTFEWCPNCNNGKGMYTTHKKHLSPEEFKELKKKQKSKGSSDGNSKGNPGISIDRTTLNHAVRCGNLSVLDESKD